DKLMIGAMASSQVVLMVWAANASAVPWPLVALGAAIAVAAMALVWFGIDRSFAAGAIAALFFGDVVVIIAGQVATAHLVIPLVAAHLALLVAMLALAWIIEEHAVATAAVPLLALGTSLARPQGAAQEFLFAGPI